jgi:hypothetical protein
MTLLLDTIVEGARLELAQGKHTPTPGMVSVAQRGVRLAHDRGGIDPGALAVARKVASGQKLSNEHIEHMASYHAVLDSPPVGNDSDDAVEHMLWAGAPGAIWSAARMAAMDISALDDHPGPDVLELDEQGKGALLEIFVRDGMGEKLDQDPDSEGLIWAPILRSGMLATRPGPNGEKKHEPLVFVPGYATDTRKEIGLQNLLDSFNDNAIQHVTIPTRHENNVLDNTGFLKSMKIVDSKKRPGEKLLVGAHDFRDPDVKKKVQLGTIANRSCGIVYDYVNTETGKKYSQAVDHVALTNRPWVTGMAAYGEISGEDDFSSREIVPMLLSEAPHTDLAVGTDSDWDGSASRFDDQQWARSCILDRSDGDAKERYGLPIREPDGTLNSNAVHNAASRINQIKGASLAQKKSAARLLISAYNKTGDKPPDGLRQIVSASTGLSEAERKSLLLADVQWSADELSMNSVTDQVVSMLDDLGRQGEVYPIYSVLDVVVTPDPKTLVRINYGDSDGTCDYCVIPLEFDGGKVTLSNFSEWVFVRKEWVTDEDSQQDKQELSSILGLSDQIFNSVSKTNLSLLSGDALRKGGAMPPTIQEALERLGLSEDQRAVIQPLLTENQTLKTQLGEVTKTARKTHVETRVKELQSQKFPPGFCRAFEEIALGDDGMVAATLNLSEEDGQKIGVKEYTVTQIAERLVASLPRDDSGALALAERANLLTSPISGRSPLTAEDQAKQDEIDGKKGPKTADEWMSEAEKVAPGVTSALNLSTSQKGA